MILGLLAAVTWGLSDLAAATMSRRYGFVRAIWLAQLGSALGLGAALLVVRPDLGSVPLVDGAALIGCGVVITAGYAGIWRAMQIGPIVIVAPLATSYLVVPALLAPFFLDEPFRLVIVVVLAVLAVGVALTVPPGHVAQPGAGRSLLLTVGSVLVSGSVALALVPFTRAHGWLIPLVGLRLGMIIALAVVRAAERRWSSPAPGADPPAPWSPWTIFAGIADTAGFAFYFLGAETGSVALVAAVAAAQPIVPVLGAVPVFGERIRPRQAAGMLLVVAGVALLGLTS